MSAKYKLGDKVQKKSGSYWRGTVVGTYSTELTPEGYAVESLTEKGSVQIYPAHALEPYVESMDHSQHAPLYVYECPECRKIWEVKFLVTNRISSLLTPSETVLFNDSLLKVVRDDAKGYTELKQLLKPIMDDKWKAMCGK